MELCSDEKLASPRESSFYGHNCKRDFLTIFCLKCGHTQRILSGSRDRTCPLCAKELYRREYSRYRGVVSNRSDLMHLVLTSKPVRFQSAEVVRKLGRDMVALFHRKPYRSVWRGILASVECKKTKNGFYYHVHCLLAGSYVPQGLISKDWREVSGFPIVWINRVYRTPLRALNYVLKYILKGASLEKSKDRSAFKKSMKGVRLIRSYGEFYNSEYASGHHVYYPCPKCGSEKCWVIMEFNDQVDLFEGIGYEDDGG